MSDSDFDLSDFLKGRGAGGPGRPGPSRPQVVRGGPPRRGRRGIAIVVIVALVVLFSASSLLGLRVSYLFLSSLGHSDVFWTPLLAKLLLFLIGALLTGGLVALNIPFWRRAAASLDRQGPTQVTLAALAVAILAGLIGGVALAGAWQDVLLWLHARPFGQSDPVFGKDYSFFLFTLPVLDDIQGLFWAVALVGLIGAIGLAAFSFSLANAPTEVTLPVKPPEGGSFEEGFRSAVTHAGIALAGIFVLAALGAHFGVYHLTTSQHDNFVGLDATQRNVTRPVLGVLQWVSLALAVLTLALVLLRRKS